MYSEIHSADYDGGTSGKTFRVDSNSIEIKFEEGEHDKYIVLTASEFGGHGSGEWGGNVKGYQRNALIKLALTDLEKILKVAS
jgi:hypothetical protein